MSGKDDWVSRRTVIDAIISEPLYESGMKKRLQMRLSLRSTKK